MEKQTNEKKVLALSFLGVITFILVVVGATYAYFAAQSGGTGNINVNANTATTDNLSFQTGSAINLSANQEDFGSGMANKSGSTFARATLTANNATNNATRNYYVYLNIESNNFEYTTGDEQAEILLKVTDPDGTEVTNISGLTRKTSGGETGFDITTQTGLITIADNYEIVSTGTVTQEWQIEVIFVNLDSDQNANTGKTFSANLIIQEEAYEEEVLAYHETCTPGTMACDIARLYNETNPETNGLYYHDADLSNGAQDNSYRYSGANPNNYVCFGSDESTCPTDNLYRIIGVFGDEVKLIKSDYAQTNLLGTNGDFYNASYSRSWGTSSYYKGSISQSSVPIYYWNVNGTNTWSESQLNTVNLNTNYLNNIGSTWSSKIANHTWQVGGASYTNVYNSPVKTAHTYEVGASAANTTYQAKIGLMYVSDYGYAASPANWSTNMGSLNNATNRDNNWMFMGLYEWTISRNSDGTSSAFGVNNTGNVNGIHVYGYYYFAVRPSFYLESSVVLEGGTGTASDPYRIA